MLPVDQTTQFNLYSPDVIHSFGIPAFLMRMDVIPGRINHFEVTPDTDRRRTRGKCYELCGAYHSRMLFNVEVVSLEDYEQYLRDLQEAGYESEGPVLGGGQAYTQEGLERAQRGRRGMTATAAHPTTTSGRKPLGQQVVRILTTTDHKLIGKLYLVTSFALVPDRRPDGAC